MAVLVEFQNVLGNGVSDVSADGFQGPTVFFDDDVAVEFGVLYGFEERGLYERRSDRGPPACANQIAGARRVVVYASGHENGVRRLGVANNP